MRRSSILHLEQPKWWTSCRWDRRDWFLWAAVLLLSRAWLPGGLVPFAFPACGAVLLSPRCQKQWLPSLLFGLAALLGLLTLGAWNQCAIFLLSLLFLSACVALENLMRRQQTGESRGHFPLRDSVRHGLYLAVSEVLASILVVSWQDALVTDVFLLLLQVAVGFVAFYLFRQVLQGFLDDASRRVMTNEEMACVAITVAVGVLGLPDLVLFGLSLRRLLCIVLVMVFSYRGGLGTGAAAGVAVGILLAAGEASGGRMLSAVMISLYAFCGFLSGLLHPYKKLGVSLGFLLGNVLLASLLTANSEIIINLYEIGFSVILFFLIPDRWTSFLRLPQLSGVKIPTVKVNYAEKLRRNARKKLQCYSGIFREMAGVCESLSEPEAGGEKSTLLQIMDHTSDRVCSKCRLCQRCWEEEFYQTYQCFLSMLYTMERQGRLPPGDVPSTLASRCPNIADLIREMRSGFDLWRVEKIWKGRLQETKRVLPAQLQGMAELLDHLTAEIDLSVQFQDQLERRILQELETQDLRARSVTVSRNKYGRYEVTVECKACGGGKQCVTAYLPVLSHVMQVPLTLSSEECSRTRTSSPWCSVTFVEEERFRALAGVASVPAYPNGVRGDAHSFLPLEQGLTMAALSDGMGSGEQAAKQSGAVLKLLELFLESGLPKLSAVRLINSLLENGVVEKELSATVDMALLNLYEGKVSFLKWGAMPSLVKRRDRVESVVASRPPVGLLGEAGREQEVQAIERELEEGDVIILYTDGVLDALREAGYPEMAFYQEVEQMPLGDPQQMADKLLGFARKLCQEQPKDDMTVMAVRVWRKA